MTNLSLVSEITDTSIENSLIGQIKGSKKYKLQFSVEGNCEMKIVLKDLITNRISQIVAQNNKYIEREYQFITIPYKDCGLIMEVKSIQGRVYNIQLYNLDEEALKR